MQHIVLIEDDQKLSNHIAVFLREHDFRVSQEFDGERGIFRIKRDHPDLVILDLNLPQLNGLQVCQSIRAEYRGLILMLTARQDDESHLQGLQLGADEYLNKPIDPEILLARIHLLLRRNQPKAEQKNIEQGHLRLEIANRKAYWNNEPLDLPAIEFDVLHALVSNSGYILSRNDLSKILRGVDYDPFDRSLDLYISRLRKKISDDTGEPKILKTVWGKGYLWVQNCTTINNKASSQN
jgi:DNA-binding response OmpR family regulator